MDWFAYGGGNIFHYCNSHEVATACSCGRESTEPVCFENQIHEVATRKIDVRSTQVKAVSSKLGLFVASSLRCYRLQYELCFRFRTNDNVSGCPVSAFVKPLEIGSLCVTS